MDQSLPSPAILDTLLKKPVVSATQGDDTAGRNTQNADAKEFLILAWRLFDILSCSIEVVRKARSKVHALRAWRDQGNMVDSFDISDVR